MPINKNAYKRYQIIHEIFSRYPRTATKKELLCKLEEQGCEISASMLEKDLSSMRNQFDLPIVYDHAGGEDPKVGVYKYSEQDVRFDIPMSDEVIKTIYSALEQLKLFQDTAVFKNAKHSLEQIMTRLEIDLKRKDDDSEGIIFYEPQPDFTGKEWIVPVYDAIVERRIITFKFLLFDTRIFHTIKPYALKEISGRWYVIGSEDNKTTVYGLDRIHHLVKTDDYFSMDENFKRSLQNAIKASVGPLNFSRRRHGVMLSYDSSVADEIKTLKVHESQRIYNEDENNLVIMVDVIMNEEFVRKAVLPYADKVQVLGPPFAVDLVLKTLGNTANRYMQDNTELDQHLLKQLDAQMAKPLFPAKNKESNK